MPQIYENIRNLADVADPTREALRALELEWRPDLPPTTVAMGRIGDALVSNIDNIPEPQMRAIFDIAEKYLIDGDEQTRSMVATGFLETLLAHSSAKRLDFHRIGPLLGIQCRKYCRSWDRFCGMVTEGLDE